MLSNAYFLAKFRFDTAENEPAKNLQTFAKHNLQILLQSACSDRGPPGDAGASTAGAGRVPFSPVSRISARNDATLFCVCRELLFVTRFPLRPGEIARARASQSLRPRHRACNRVAELATASKVAGV